MFELIKNNRSLNTIDSVFDNFFNDNFFNINTINTMDYYCSSDEKKYYIEVALPGLDKRDVNLNLNDNFLYLNYERKDESCNTFWKRSFNRRIKLPNDINSDSIKANLKNGVLNIEIEKDKITTQNKKIEIK